MHVSKIIMHFFKDVMICRSLHNLGDWRYCSL